MIKILKIDRFTNLPDLVLIDLDNTLYSYNLAHTPAYKAMKAKACKLLKIQPKIFDYEYERARKVTHTRLNGTASSHNRLLYLTFILEKFGLGSQIFIASDLEQTYWNEYLLNLHLFDDVINFFYFLKKNNITIVLVTDLLTHIQFRKLLSLNIQDFFDFIVTSEEAGFEKPHKNFFKYTLSKLDFQPKHIWMIGDNYEKDIKVAKFAINALTLLKVNKKLNERFHNINTDLVFDDYSQLISFVNKLHGKL